MTLLLSVTTLYVVLALLATVAARADRAAPPLATDALPRVSVLVAARNEEDALPRCLRALQLQDYPADRIEFLIADDHSTDGTAALIDAFAGRDARFRRINVAREAEDGLEGKARAVHAAYRHADANLLLLTDADCFPPPAWARNLASQFRDAATGMVCGVTLVEHRTLLDRVQALDWLLLLTLAAAASGARLPLTAQGNNMAFRRDAYEAVGGYPALPASVTEDYALFRAIRGAGWQVRLVLDAPLGNFTLPLTSLREVFAQRKRWARGGLAAPPWAYLAYLLFYLTHLLLFGGLFGAPFVTLALLALKIFADGLMLRTGMQRMGARGLLGTLLHYELYLFGYVLLMPFSLLLSPRIRWKERRF